MNKFVTLFTDASHCPRTKAWGWAAWCKHGDPAVTHRRSGGGQHCPGSNEAEVRAISAGVAMTLESVDVTDKVVVIQSDCTAALEMADHSALKTAGALAVRMKHVKGHQGVKNARAAVNTWTDRNAYKEMAMHRQAIDEGETA